MRVVVRDVLSRAATPAGASGGLVGGFHSSSLPFVEAVRDYKSTD